MTSERNHIDTLIEATNEAIEEKREMINDKQKELESFDISAHFDESDFKAYFRHETVEVLGRSFRALDVLEEMDYTAFREGFNNWLDDLDPSDCDEYREIEEEKEKLEDELLDLEEELEELHDRAFDMDNAD